jgi:hypothetical protein
MYLIQIYLIVLLTVVVTKTSNIVCIETNKKGSKHAQTVTQCVSFLTCYYKTALTESLYCIKFLQNKNYFFPSKNSKGTSSSSMGFSCLACLSRRRICFSSLFFFRSSLCFIMAGSIRFFFFRGSALQ